MLKKLIKKVILRERYDSNTYIEYLKKRGATIGDYTYIFNPSNTFIDNKNTFLINIGSYCKIASGVTILSHDYSYSVLRRVYGDIIQKSAVTEIGNNVFIGINSIILMGAKIGDNVVIGAGSVVSGVVPDNQVWAGNPAKFICTLDEYHKKCLKHFGPSAKNYCKQYKIKFGRYPSKKELNYYCTLFSGGLEDISLYESMQFHGDNHQDVVENCLDEKITKNKKYLSYEDFISEIDNELKDELK